MTTMGTVAGGMDIHRQANNMKSCSAETKDAKTSSLFGLSEHSLSQRLIDDRTAAVDMAAPAMQNYRPTGMRFHPTDLELVAYFLHEKAEVEKTGWYSDVIHECNDFYGDKEPWVIWEAYKSSTHEEGEPLYFYTKRTKQNRNGKRFARKVGSGTWSGEYSKEVLTAGEDGTKIGTVRNFRYEKGREKDQNGGWLMHEYESEFYQNGGNDYVICVLRKKPRKTPKDETTKKNGVKRSKPDDVVAETEDDQNDQPKKRLEGEEISEVGKEESSNQQGCSSSFTQLQEQYWYHHDQGTSSYYYPAENNDFPEIFDTEYDDGATIDELLGPITDEIEYYKSISFQDQLYRSGDDNSNIGDYLNGGFSQLLNDQPTVDCLANI